MQIDLKRIILSLSLFSSLASTALADQEVCYKITRSLGHSIEDATRLCQGVGDLCFQTLSLNRRSLKESASECRDVGSECFADVMKARRSVSGALATCKGVINDACYKEARYLGETKGRAARLCQKQWYLLSQ